MYHPDVQEFDHKKYSEQSDLIYVELNPSDHFKTKRFLFFLVIRPISDNFFN